MAGGRPSLGVEVADVRLPTPVMIASGCFSFARDLAGLLDLRRVGGIVTRSITLHPTRGSAATRMAETPSGLLSAVGLQNPGVDAFQAELAALGKLGVPLFASVAGTTVEEYMRVAAKLVSLRLVAGIELNLSCPNAARDGQLFACEPDQAAQAVSAVSGVSRVPVFAKLSSETADIVGVARACIAAGARGLTLINTIPGMAIDVETQRPKLAAVTGGLSGPAIRPIAVHAVFRVARALPNVPILGVGGIVNERDALEFLGVGAWAVQVGTAMFANPAAPVEIALGIGKHLVAQGLAGPAELRGRATAVAAS